MARAYGQRPSALLDIDPGSWLAYQVDLAAWELGNEVEGELANRKKGEDPNVLLQKLLGESIRASTVQAAPLSTRPGIRKIQVPESGVW